MPVDHSIRSGTLYINAVQKDAEGVYTCLSIGGSGTVLSRADATLRVLGEGRGDGANGRIGWRECG